MEKNQQTTRDSLIDLTDFMKIAEAADQYARQQNGGGAGSGIIQESFIQGCKHMASQFKSSERENWCVDCEQEKQVHSLCFECACKLGSTEVHNKAIDEAIRIAEREQLDSIDHSAYVSCTNIIDKLIESKK